MLKGVTKEGPRAPLFFPVISLLVLSTITAGAQNVEVSALETCAGLETEALKLACFEAIIAEGSSSVSESVSVESAEPVEDPLPIVEAETPLIDHVVDVPTTVSEKVAVPASSVPVNLDSASAAESASVEEEPRTTDSSTSTTSVVPTENESTDFGSEQLNVSSEPLDEGRTITATVVDVSRDSRRHLRFHLASGQVWRQIEPRHFSYPKNREFEIEISQGLLGAYGMRVGEKGRMIKIRRIQ